MTIIMSNKNKPNNSLRETGTSSEGLSPGSLGTQGQVPVGRNQTTTNKTLLNADNEDNVVLLGFQKKQNGKIYLGIIWKLQALMGFRVNHKMKMILILTITIRKYKHGH